MAAAYGIAYLAALLAVVYMLARAPRRRVTVRARAQR